MLDVEVCGHDVIADGVVAVRLRGEGLPAWEPGAHLDVHLPNGLVRQYSLCGEPGGDYRIGVLREPSSRGGSDAVHTLRVGERLRISEPRNNFALEPADRYLFIAGGIGITPILAMVRAAHGEGADWRLLYGGRSRKSMAFVDELLAIDPERVVLHPQDEDGLLPLRSWLDAPRGDTLIYCCGPEPLLRAVEYEAVLWPLHALRIERFTAKPLAEPAREEAFDVELARTGRTLTVRQEQSILDAVADAGVELLSSCRQGVCGTCVTRVLGGRPDHRDSILTAEARENGDRMYLCVSRSCSDRLVLDL